MVGISSTTRIRVSNGNMTDIVRLKAWICQGLCKLMRYVMTLVGLTLSGLAY
jgi:hypothetical protein